MISHVHPPARKPRRRAVGAMTILELLVVIAIISLLAALLMPSLKNARQAGKGAACLSNLRQIAMVLNIYANENDDLLPPIYGVNSPPDSRWMWRLRPYGLNDRVIFCPEDPLFTPTSTPLDPDDRKTHSYILNGLAELGLQIGQSPFLGDISNSSEVVLLSEKKPTETDYYLSYPAEDPDHELDQARHREKANYLFADSHAQSLPTGKSLVPHNLWTIDPSD